MKSIYINDNANDAVSEEALTQDRQRLFLERTTADLKNKLSNDLHASNANRMRIMKVRKHFEKQTIECFDSCSLGEFSFTSRIE